jgi:hypothetical protein
MDEDESRVGYPEEAPGEPSGSERPEDRPPRRGGRQEREPRPEAERGDDGTATGG